MKKIFSFVIAALVAMTMSAEAISVAEALQIAGQLAQGETTEQEYEIEGYVSAMQGSEDGGWAKYGNQIFWIADEQGSTANSNEAGALEIYQGVASEQVYVTDKVSVKAKLTNYNGLLETAKKGVVTIIEKNAERPEPGEEADVVFTSADFNGQGTSGTGSLVTAVKDGVTFTCDKAFGDQYGVRCYKNGVVTISSTEQQIGKIVFEFATVSGKYYNGDLPDEIVVNGQEWTNTLTNQARMNKISIFFGEYDPIDPPVVVLDTVTVAEAVEIGMALADNAKTEKDYVVAGYVVKAYEPSEGYTDQTWFMADEAGAFGEFEAFRCTPDSHVAEGDYMYVKGKIQKYVKDDKAQIEIGNGTATHGEAPQGIENIELTNEAQKVMVDGVMYIVRDGKMFNVQGAQVR